MPSLRELQEGFAAALFNPGAGRQAPGIRADGISPAVRLGFYRTSVFENYRKGLSATYPAIEKLVGTGYFSILADEYARRCPSRSGDVGRHAEHFAEFLRAHPCARELPYLRDVARLEWCIEESFHEAEHVPLSLTRLAGVPVDQCERLRLLLAPSCRLLSSAFPVDRIWQICQPDFVGEVEADLDRGVDLLIRRDGYAVAVEPLPRGDFAMLGALSSGHNLRAAFGHASGVDPTFDPAAFLQRQVRSGVLVDFTLPADVEAL